MRKLSVLTMLAMMSLPALAAPNGPDSNAPAAGVANSTKPTHTAEAMTRGHHMMPGNKHDQMSNKMMPGMNPKCADEAALARMPADHRAACHKKD